MPHSSTPNPTPILLLKTRSTPNDAYSTLFSPPSNNYTATFIPVLSHRPNASNLSHLHFLLRSNISTVYGGLIFTSQRAVEAFATTLAGGDEQLVELGSMVGCPFHLIKTPSNGACDHNRSDQFINPIIRSRARDIAYLNRAARHASPEMPGPRPGDGEWREASTLHARAL